MLLMRGIIRKRPWTSSLIGGTSAVASAAVLVEIRANWLEQHGDTEDGHNRHLPRTYDWERINNYWSSRPVTLLSRFVKITYELGPLAVYAIKDFYLCAPRNDDDNATNNDLTNLQQVHASRLCQALTNLGPAFVKAGQQLSIRPDLAPPPVLKELQTLCDQVRPIANNIALALLREELHVTNLNEIFVEGDDLAMVASASLGQVYQGTLREVPNQRVAVKIQRPHMRASFSLDLFLLQKVGCLVDLFTTTFTNQPPFHHKLYESFARGSYAELDYEAEACNQQMFQGEFRRRQCPVVVPNVYPQYSTEKVLVSEWIDGVKLADSSKERIRELIPVGVELFLTQLLDIGKFHSDPHPGNLLVTNDGKLCLLDFGLCAEVDEASRNAMTKALVHLLLRDFDALVAEDAKELGFLPHDFDTTELKPILTKILTVGVMEAGSNMSHRRRKLMEISNELNEVFFRYPFSVPPFFALITRGLGLLEGIALTGDPDFDIFRASVPYARRRAVHLLGQHSLRQMRRLTGGTNSRWRLLGW